ncbi:MAG: GNAT family N-acetyltransferase [Huintestinicola sp.]|uniref:GNAT family N-acetyltransferase n=1 Tax=Huintestinicola sp. TaxID=2981661 RepID=UPI003EFCE2F3
MNKTLQYQLSRDYCCTPEEVSGRENIFTVYTPLEGRRKFGKNSECFLKICAVNGKILVTGREDIVSVCREKYSKLDGAWFMEAQTVIELESLVRKFGYKIKQLHPFFISGKITAPEPYDFDTVFYTQNEIEQFRDDDRFDEAYAFCEETPDVLGIAAVKNGDIIGMAGASADSPYMYQIGINVLPEHRGNGIGAALVSLLKNKVLELEKLPYYGTSVSHIASQKTAVKAGFIPAWTELVTEKEENKSD